MQVYLAPSLFLSRVRTNVYTSKGVLNFSRFSGRQVPFFGPEECVSLARALGKRERERRKIGLSIRARREQFCMMRRDAVL